MKFDQRAYDAEVEALDREAEGWPVYSDLLHGDLLYALACRSKLSSGEFLACEEIVGGLAGAWCLVVRDVELMLRVFRTVVPSLQMLEVSSPLDFCEEKLLGLVKLYAYVLRDEMSHAELKDIVELMSRWVEQHGWNEFYETGEFQRREFEVEGLLQADGDPLEVRRVIEELQRVLENRR